MYSNVNHNVNWDLSDNDMTVNVISCDKCPTLVADVDNEGGYARVRGGNIWEIFTFLSVFL